MFSVFSGINFVPVGVVVVVVVVVDLNLLLAGQVFHQVVGTGVGGGGAHGRNGEGRGADNP